MVRELEDAELAVLKVFNDEFPDEEFHEWNQDIGDDAAEHIIATVGRAATINVRMFIEDLKQRQTP